MLRDLQAFVALIVAGSLQKMSLFLGQYFLIGMFYIADNYLIADCSQRFILST